MIAEWLAWILLVAVVLAVLYLRPGRETGFALVGAAVAAFIFLGADGAAGKLVVAVLFVAVTAVFNVPQLRRRLVSAPLLRFYRSSMPEISQTERDALEAGTTWWDAELFTGKPDWTKLLEFPKAELSAEEQAFLDGPVEELCALLNDYEIDNVTRDLPREAWELIKREGFFGMIIPQEFGGKAFSQYGHAAVVMKIATRSISAALTVMIPNSVGPAKLLLKYGTEEQKRYYLPRLARGEEIPCFALTAPEAGSDAGAIPDTGVVCRGEYEGREVLGIRLNFNKRYITLGPVATLLGVAFKLRDPDGLLGDKEELGITLALVPASTPGVETGARHDPMHMSFMNGPVRGKDVFVPLEQVIGGPEYVGKGWRMLMESLTDGRAISLPALSTASAKASARLAGAYSVVRRQFKVEIGNFEGVEEALARIAGNTYAMDAARMVTLAALDQGHKPSVISAIVKYNLTERARQVINDAIEVHGGAAICLGPRNPLGQLYSFPPIAVTVEGHNILTRNLITFGQGAIRCHPYLLDELTAAQMNDEMGALDAFDRAVTGHVGFAVSNGVRSLLLGLTGGRLARVGGDDGPVRGHLQRLTRMSAAFALATDILLLAYRGSIKRRERLSARMADVISQLYLASAAIKHFRDQGSPRDDLPLLHWVVEDALYRMQQSFDVLLQNIRPRWLAVILRALVFPLGRRFTPPADELDRKVAGILREPGKSRDRLTAGMYLSDGGDRVADLDEVLRRLVDVAPLDARLRQARRDGRLSSGAGDMLTAAVAAGVLDPSEASRLQEAESARRDALDVDEFARLP